jgi:hypothetical protein
MATKTFLKDDGVFVYADYVGAKGVRRLAELTTANPYQKIRRAAGQDVVAVLVSKAWYDTRVAAYTAVQAALEAVSVTETPDDYLSNNFSVLVDLLNGTNQVKSQAKRWADLGYSQDAFRAFSFVDTKKFTVDDGDTSSSVDGKSVGGNVKGYLLRPDHFDALEAAPTETTYSGVGDGTVAVTLKPGKAVAETITITCTVAAANGGTFSVTGSVSGSHSDVVVGNTLDTAGFSLVISDGATDFEVGDQFEVTSYAAF